MTPYEDCRSATDTFPLLAMFAPPDVSDVPGVSDWRPHMPLIRTLLIVQLRNIETEGMAMLPTSVYRLLGTREPEWTGAMTVRFPKTSSSSLETGLTGFEWREGILIRAVQQ